MLQTLHDKLKGIFAIVVLVALGIVFIFWGVEVSVGTFTDARGIEVNGRELPVAEVQRAFQEQLARYQVAFGEAGVPDEMRDALRRNVLEDAVRRELIRQRTSKLRYQASDAEVLESIREVPAFQVAGEFSADAYHAALQSINMSPEQFEAEQRQLVLARHLDRGLYGSAFVLPQELARDVALRRERRTLAWAVVPADGFEDDVRLDEAAVAAWYESHADEYMTEEYATVGYVELDIDDFAAAVNVDEARLREYYEEVRARYTEAGRRRSRHILVEEGDDPAAAEAEAKRVAERAKAGEDFAALAREFSDDAGSRDAGGDIGFAARAELDPAYADALWDMKPGEVRGPVKSEFGWHVIRLEEVQEEKVRPFEEVRAELDQELRRSEVEKAFGDAQEELDTVAFEAGGDIAAVASRVGRPLQRIERYTRAGSPKLASSRAVTEAVFSPEVLAGDEVRTVELERGRVVAVGVLAHEASRPKPLEEVRDQVAEAARRDAAEKLAAARAEEIARALSGGGAWAESTKPLRADDGSREPRPRTRDDADVPAPVREAAFAAAPPEGGPRYGTATLADGDAAVWMVTAVEAGQFAALRPEERQQAQDDARNRVAMQDANAYVVSMRERAEVDVNPQLFE